MQLINPPMQARRIGDIRVVKFLWAVFVIFVFILTATTVKYIVREMNSKMFFNTFNNDISGVATRQRLKNSLTFP